MRDAETERRMVPLSALQKNQTVDDSTLFLIPGKKNSITLIDAIRGFYSWSNVANKLSIKTLVVYRGILDKLLLFIQDYERLVDTIKLDDLMLFLNWYKKQWNISTSRENTIKSCLHSFFNYCRIFELTEINIAEGLPIAKSQKKVPKTLTPEQVLALLTNPTNNASETAILYLLYYTGIRVSELAQIKIAAVNFELKTLMVLGKGNKERLIPITNDCLTVLKNYIDSIAQSEWLFPNAQNTDHISVRTIQRIIAELGEKNNILNLHPHKFRATCATELYQKKTDLFRIKNILGHESLSTTEIYTRIPDELVREAVERL